MKSKLYFDSVWRADDWTEGVSQQHCGYLSSGSFVGSSMHAWLIIIDAWLLVVI
jgi:hypothetical protein